MIFRDIVDEDVSIVQCSANSFAIYNAAKLSKGHPFQYAQPEERVRLYTNLIKAGHLSVFEHCSITYLLHAPIFVLRQIMRHRTAKYTEVSLRYSHADPTFWASNIWSKEVTERLYNNTKKEYETYLEVSQEALTLEDARTVLPLSIYSTVMITYDLRNLMHFFDLRLAMGAQCPTREVARKMFRLFFHAFDDVATAYAAVREIKLPLEEVKK